MSLKMNLLSEVKFWIDGKALPSMRSRTATALLVYLAYHPQSFSRDYLATFFWPDKAQDHAAANLRSTLRLLRPNFQSYITIGRKEVTFNQKSPFKIDAIELEETLDRFIVSSNTAKINPELSKRLPLLLATDQAAFMPSFHLANSSKFEQWLSNYRYRLQQKIEQAMRPLVQSWLRAGEYEMALTSAKRLVELDPYNEVWQRLLMEIRWRTGKRNDALRQYKALATLLKRELDIVPSEETLMLRARIRAQQSRPPAHLPLQTTPFIGRDSELLSLFNKLMDPTCRMLTIMGPGGIGKTRLLIAFGELLCARFPGPFPDGIFYIPLVQLASADYLATPLITGLSLTISGNTTPQEEIINHVKGKEMAILLDNMEHLLDEPADIDHCVQLIEALIHDAPKLKIVITSRSKLNLTEEWIFRLDGLRLPPKSWEPMGELLNEELKNGQNRQTENSKSLELAQTYPATTFFVENGRRINSRLNLNFDELSIIGDICHLLDGFPLGIEMASALLDHLTPAEIKAQLIFESSNLASPMRNTPDRHRSLWKVFAYSYQRLSTAEKACFCQLAIFNARFDVDAAQTVALASKAILAHLVNHSLLKKISTNEGLSKHYEMHRLLRQFALERLVAEYEMKDALEIRHIDYFVDFLDKRGEGLRQGGPPSLFTEVETYIDDIRGVWQKLIPNLTDLPKTSWAKTEQALEALLNFYFAKGWIAEGLELTGKLAETDPSSTISLKSALWQAEYESGLGNYTTAESGFKEVLGRSRNAGSRPVELEALNGLGRVKYLQGDMESAENLFQKGLDLARYEEDPISISLALNCLANTVAEAHMDYDKAVFLLSDSLDISRSAGDQLGTARALINLGAVAQERNQLQEAQDLYQQSLDLYQIIGYQHGIAAALNYLGQIAIKNGDFMAAQALLKQSLDLYLANRDRRGEADVLRQMGNVARGQKKIEDALSHYEDALAIAQTIGGDLLGLAVLLEIAELHKVEGKSEIAAKIATQILNHPAMGDEIATLAKTLLASVTTNPTEILVDSDLTMGQMIEMALAVG